MINGMNNNEFVYWDIEEHTLIKHKSINDYIDKWVQILGKYNDLTIFDCYGGNGIYKNSKGDIFLGSPLLILKSIQKYHNKTGISAKLVVIEKNKNIITNLRKVIENHGLEDFCVILNNDFAKDALEIIELYKSDANFFFIDPFGYDVDFKILEYIMALEKTEIVLNFMYNGINRGISVESVHPLINRLFGCSDWIDCKGLEKQEREEKIMSIYKNQCKSIARYVFPYRLCFPDKDRTYYYLFHMSNNLKGSIIMKSSFAKFNYGRVEYLGKLKNQDTIFDIFKTDFTQDYLIDVFESQTKTYDAIIEAIIDDCPYLESDLRNALKKAEKENSIIVNRITSKTTRGLSGEDTIHFKEKDERN